MTVRVTYHKYFAKTIHPRPAYVRLFAYLSFLT